MSLQPSATPSPHGESPRLVPKAPPPGLRRMTLLALDIRGFSAILRRLGCLPALLLLQRFFRVMTETVSRHGGRVEKILGDGFLARFEDAVGGYGHADRAALSALDMRRRLEPLNRIVAAEHGLILRIGCGIQTGQVACGEIVVGRRLETAVIGEPVNGVFRLQRLLRTIPDGILLGPAAMEETSLPLEVKPLDVPAHLRRALGHVIVYELLGLRGEAEFPCA
ncbi:MAG: adenylate/guanylate cyclase domain-containing protein [Desulfobacterales bacterium]